MIADREEWRWVPGYEGLYIVSDHGNVMSVPRTVHGDRLVKNVAGVKLSKCKHSSGYQQVVLYRNAHSDLALVHRIVAEAFIPNPDGKPCVNHINGDKTDNRVENLEWVTHKENSHHACSFLGAYRHGHLSDIDIAAIRSDTRLQREIADEYGITQSEVSSIQTGKSYMKAPGSIRKPDSRAIRQRKLSDSDVMDIISSSATGKLMASKYGVSRSTISKIRNGKRYKEVVAHD